MHEHDYCIQAKAFRCFECDSAHHQVKDCKVSPFAKILRVCKKCGARGHVRQICLDTKRGQKLYAEEHKNADGSPVMLPEYVYGGLGGPGFKPKQYTPKTRRVVAANATDDDIRPVPRPKTIEDGVREGTHRRFKHPKTGAVTVWRVPAAQVAQARAEAVTGPDSASEESEDESASEDEEDEGDVTETEAMSVAEAQGGDVSDDSHLSDERDFDQEGEIDWGAEDRRDYREMAVEERVAEEDAISMIELADTYSELDQVLPWNQPRARLPTGPPAGSRVRAMPFPVPRAAPAGRVGRV